MNTLSYRTVSVNKEAADKKWVLVDAEGQALGRLASKVANIARGKYKTCYTPNMDCGDNVVIINAGKIVLTGKKMDGKVYTRYTGYPGGQRTLTAREVMQGRYPSGALRPERHAAQKPPGRCADEEHLHLRRPRTPAAGTKTRINQP